MKKCTRDEAIILLHKYMTDFLVKEGWYKYVQPYVKAIVFYGSTSKGLNRADSDIDLLIFVPLKIEEKYSAGEYVYWYQSREINIVLRSIERLRKLAWENDDAVEAEVFRNSEIIFETDSEVRELIGRIQAPHANRL